MRKNGVKEKEKFKVNALTFNVSSTCFPCNCNARNAKECISEAIDNAVERVFEAYKERKEQGWDKQTIKELEQRLKEIEEYWEDVRKRRKT